MLKGTILYEVENKVGAGVDTIHDLVKVYLLLGIKYGVSNFDYIQYRGHQLIINDNGYKDAMTIEADLRSQITEVNKIEDIKDGE